MHEERKFFLHYVKHFRLPADWQTYLRILKNNMLKWQIFMLSHIITIVRYQSIQFIIRFATLSSSHRTNARKELT